MSQFSSTAKSSVSSAPLTNNSRTASLDASTHAKAIQLATVTLEMCATAGVGNPTVAISATHLFTTLLYQSMRWDVASPRDASADRLILSDAAFAPLLYAACADLGVAGFVDGSWRALTTADLATFGAVDSALPTTPTPGTLAIVEHAVGAHGAGLSLAVGHALAARLESSARRVFCVISDAELREGQLSEALASIIEERLTNVIPVFVASALSTNDRANAVDGIEALVNRLNAMGFETIPFDGHAPAQIRDAVELTADASQSTSKSSKPKALVARCIKGWGAKSLQGGSWSGRVVTGEKLATALQDLRNARIGLTNAFAIELSRPIPREKTPQNPAVSMHAALEATPDFARAMKDADMLAVYQGGRLSTRRAMSLALRALGRAHGGVSVLECDARANMVSDMFAADRALTPRFNECRSAESHMIGVACGLASAGRVAIASASARSLVRAHEQLEVAARSGVSLTVVATNSGLGAIAEGASATSTNDVAWFRAIAAQQDASGHPTGYLLQPSDAFAAYALTLAAAAHEGLTIMRLPAGEQEFLYNAETTFNLGKFEVLVEGRDLLIVTAGAMVHEVNRALDDLDKAGIDATIVDLYSLPFDEAALLDLANANGGRILVIEDNASGALASAVSDACTAAGDPFIIESMCVRTPIVSARSFDEALRIAKLSASDIVARASRLVGIDTKS